jgi:alkanesulfonate monooxygenase SsuD/methylene tetrahydromethanopterin reductase-like flavin-dependent oxidoreductase (luciferase family)
VRLSTVILPLERWPQSRVKWRKAEEMGFYAGYTYDHLSWRRLQERPWFGAVPTLSAAAVETSTLRLGTLVTTPNFRHPVPLAKDLLSVDDLSNGRLIIGIGAGTSGDDSHVLGEVQWSPQERIERFVNFVDLLDQLLSEPLTNYDGPYYRAHEARMLPGTVQLPRPPFCVAATGPRGMQSAAIHGQAWVSIGLSEKTDTSCYDTVTAQLLRLNRALDHNNRARDSIDKVLLDGLNSEKPLVSLDAFVDWAGRYQALGMTELVIHWPEPDSIFDVDMKTFERIASEGLAQLTRP